MNVGAVFVSSAESGCELPGAVGLVGSVTVASPFTGMLGVAADALTGDVGLVASELTEEPFKEGVKPP